MVGLWGSLWSPRVPSFTAGRFFFFFFLLPALRFRLLKHTKLNVVAFLSELPKTQHDVNSFMVDVCLQTVSRERGTSLRLGGSK